MHSQWKPTSRFMHMLSMAVAVIISASLLGAVLVGITATDELNVALAGPM